MFQDRYVACDEAVTMMAEERYDEAAAAAESFYENAQMAGYCVPLHMRMLVDDIVCELAPLLVIEREQL